MGIRNIHILTEPKVNVLIDQARAALEAKLIREHRSGLHPYGSMRRECPLCQTNR